MTEGENRRPLKAIRQFFVREPLDGTRLSAIALGAALTAMPLAILIAGNHHEIMSLAPIYVIAGVAALIAATATFLLSKVLAPHVSGILCGVFGYAFFSLPLPQQDDTFSLFVLWLAGSLVASVIGIWLASDSTLLVRLASLVTTVAAISLSVLVPLPSSDSELPSSPSSALAFQEDADFVRQPNVYLFVLDAFSHPSYIEKEMAEFDIDFTPAITRLEDLDFAWEQRARANYTETRLSIPSTLNASYPVTADNPDFTARHRGEPAMRGHNATTSFFTEAGYEYWHAGSGIWEQAGCDSTVADRCLVNGSINLETQNAIWGNTPIRSIVEPDLGDAETPESVVSRIKAARASSTSDSPYFVFTHLILPHHPYRFDRNCEPVPSQSTLTTGHLQEFRGEYAEQTLCATSQLANAMEELIEEDPTAVIILQGDHGSSFTIDQDISPWSEQNIRERMDIFRMTRLPEDCRYDDPAAQSLINTLPVLAACMTGSEPALIAPRLIITFYNNDAPYDVIHPDDRTDE